jgi:rubrerythrin
MVASRAVPADLNSVQPTEAERADLEHSIDVERSNARFYRAVASLPGDDALSSAFKRLGNIEAEHCSLFCKLAGVPKPSDLTEPGQAPESWEDAIAESRARESRARDFYADAATRATSERIREVFTALTAIETDHLEVDGIAEEMLGD